MVGALDPFRITNKLDDTLLDVIVTRLEARGKHRFFQNVLREYLDTMDHFGHPGFLSLRVRMAPVVPSIHATHI
jgi:hypothetical protein